MRNRVWAIVQKIILLSTATLASLTLLEISLRFYNPIETRLRGDRIVLPIQKTYISKNVAIAGLDHTITHSKNSLGFRGPESPSDIDSYFSIIAVGGSTTECSLISDGKTWTDVFASHLDERFSNIWVNNAGLDGHSTFGHTVLVNDILLKKKPNLLLFLIGHNDIGLEKPTIHTASHVGGPVQMKSVEGFIKSLAYRSEVMNVVLNSFRMIRAKIRGLDHSSIDLRNLSQLRNSEKDVEQILERHQLLYIPLFEKRVINLVTLCSDNDIRVVLMTQPALYGEGIDDITGVNLATIKVSSNRSGMVKWNILELYNEATREIAADHEIFLIDLANELPKNSKYFYDFIHFNNAGALEVGTIVAAHLEQYLLRRSDDPVVGLAWIGDS